MLYIKKILYEIRSLHNDLLDVRDILGEIKGDTSAEMITLDLIRRNFNHPSLVMSLNAPAEGAGKRSRKDFIPLQRIQREYGVNVDTLKKTLDIKGIEYGTHFFKEGGFRGHVQSMVQVSDLLRIQKALEKAGFKKGSAK